MNNKKIIVLVGPSGSGKTSIGEALIEKGIPRLVTTTTRAPRETETDGVDYYFRDFTKLDIDEFVEQTIYNGNRYGLTKEEVNSKLLKYDVVHVSLDQPGAKAVKKAYPAETEIVFVHISEEQMIERMKQRGDSKAEIENRVAYSRQTNELKAPPETDLIVENIDVKKTAQEIIDQLWV